MEQFVLDLAHDFIINDDPYSSKQSQSITIECTWKPNILAYQISEDIETGQNSFFSKTNIDNAGNVKFDFEIPFTLIDNIQPSGKYITYSFVNKSLSGSKMSMPNGLFYDFIREDGRGYLYPNDRWIAQYPKLFNWGKALRRHVGVLCQYHPENEYVRAYEGSNDRNDPFIHCRIEDTALGEPYDVTFSNEMKSYFDKSSSPYGFLSNGMLNLSFVTDVNFNMQYYLHIKDIADKRNNSMMRNLDQYYYPMLNEQGYYINMPLICLKRKQKY